MHPLPRREELSYDIDQDKRAAYFKQAEYGVPIRMALIVALLGLADFELEMEGKGKAKTFDQSCGNPNCITVKQNNVQYKYNRVCINYFSQWQFSVTIRDDRQNFT